MRQENKIRVNIYLIIVCLLGLFSYIIIEHTIRNENIQNKLLDLSQYHLRSIFYLGAIKAEYFDMRGRQSGLDLTSEQSAGDDGSQAAIAHGQRTTGILKKHLSAMTILQRDYGHREFDSAFERLREKLQNLIEQIDSGGSGQNSTGVSLFQRVSELDLPIAQLNKLHWDGYNADTRAQIEEAEQSARTILMVDGAAAAVVAFLIFLLLGQVSKIVRELEATDAELKSLNSELENLVDERTTELRSAQQGLLRKERLAAVGQVTATVSHELRNPLGAIRNATDVIKKLAGEQDGKLVRAVALLERSQTRCDKIIAELLNFTRVQELNRETTKIDQWLGAELEDYDLPPNIALSLLLRSGVEIAVDRDRLRRAVTNAVDNARHAMEEAIDNGEDSGANKLAVITRVAEGRVEISVQDTGPGISDEDLPKVFEPLYSTKSIGTGLGLPLVKKIMEQHDGDVEVSSTPGVGTEVVLWLPLAIADKGTST